MSGSRPGPGIARGLHVGDHVDVRSFAEIVSTLDEAGQLDGLPFMPEMARYCGRRFTVASRADKTCDTLAFRGLRRMLDTVHLGDIRCDGSEHGGCQAGCLLFWKEAWLRRVGGPRTGRRSAPIRGPVGGSPVGLEPGGAETFGTEIAGAEIAGAQAAAGDEHPADLAVGAHSSDHERLRRLSTRKGPGGVERFTCQATELVRASRLLPWWDVRQYVRDVRSGNVSLGDTVANLARWFLNKVRSRLLGRSPIPGVRGTLTKTPSMRLDLRAGDTVRVRSKDEIAATLDVANRNRGLSFDAEMLRFCGGEFTVLRRVERLIDENNGEMIRIGGDCIILDSVTCAGAYHRGCPRRIYPYWREAWLEGSTVSAVDLPGAEASSGAGT